MSMLTSSKVVEFIGVVNPNGSINVQYSTGFVGDYSRFGDQVLPRRDSVQQACELYERQVPWGGVLVFFVYLLCLLSMGQSVLLIFLFLFLFLLILLQLLFHHTPLCEQFTILKTRLNCPRTLYYPTTVKKDASGQRLFLHFSTLSWMFVSHYNRNLQREIQSYVSSKSTAVRVNRYSSSRIRVKYQSFFFCRCMSMLLQSMSYWLRSKTRSKILQRRIGFLDPQ